MINAVEYFSMPSCPGQFFKCSRLSATLSTASCASRWKQANQSHDRCQQCAGCPIGAQHAGETQASTSLLMGKPICARCHRSSDRLVNKKICVSCYNRQREWVIGRNAKGTIPVKQKPLRPMQLPYLAGGSLQIAASDLAESTSELIISVLRDSRKDVVFGFFARALA